MFLATFKGCISDVPEFDIFVSEVEAKRLFNKESSQVLSDVLMEESPRSSVRVPGGRTKLAQSCTDWLYVQHWYTVVPEPSMRVTLWALMGVGDDCDKRTQDTPPCSIFSFLSATIASVQADSAVPGVLFPRSCPYLSLCFMQVHRRRCHRSKPASMRYDGGLCDVDQHILALIVCGFGWHTRTFVFAPCNCPYQAWFALLAG